MLNEHRTRMVLQMEANEMKEVDEYRWRNRLPSKTEAVRQLIAKGLEAEAKQGEAA